jgi:hypothetical protein
MLVFDVELMKITDAPPHHGFPGMGGPGGPGGAGGMGIHPGMSPVHP